MIRKSSVSIDRIVWWAWRSIKKTKQFRQITKWNAQKACIRDELSECAVHPPYCRPTLIKIVEKEPKNAKWWKTFWTFGGKRKGRYYVNWFSDDTIKLMRLDLRAHLWMDGSVLYYWSQQGYPTPRKHKLPHAWDRISDKLPKFSGFLIKNLSFEFLLKLTYFVANMVPRLMH